MFTTTKKRDDILILLFFREGVYKFSKMPVNISDFLKELDTLYERLQNEDGKYKQPFEEYTVKFIIAEGVY